MLIQLVDAQTTLIAFQTAVEDHEDPSQLTALGVYANTQLQNLSTYLPATLLATFESDIQTGQYSAAANVDLLTPLDNQIAEQNVPNSAYIANLAQISDILGLMRDPGLNLSSISFAQTLDYYVSRLPYNAPENQHPAIQSITTLTNAIVAAAGDPTSSAYQSNVDAAYREVTSLLAS